MRQISIKQMQEMLNHVSTSPSTSTYTKAICVDFGLDMLSVIGFFAYIGMSPLELLHCPKSVFSDYYEKNLPISNKRNLEELRGADMDSFLDLCSEYGASQVSAALHASHTTAFKFYKKNHKLQGQVESYTYPKPIRYDSNSDFFKKINALLRRANPKIPNFRQNYENLLRTNSNANQTNSGNIATQTVSSTRNPIQLDDPIQTPHALKKPNTNDFNTNKKRPGEEKLTYNPSDFFKKQRTALPETQKPSVFLPPVQLNEYAYLLNIALQKLTDLNLMDYDGINNWIIELNDLFEIYFGKADANNADLYVTQLFGLIPELDQDRLDKFEVIKNLHPTNITIYVLTKLYNLDMPEIIGLRNYPKS